MIRRDKGTLILVISSLLLTLFYWLILILQKPIFRMIPDYYWHAMRLIDKPLPMFWLFLPLLVISIVITKIIIKHTDKTIMNLSLLILLGWAVQMSFGYSEGHEINGIRSRMVNTGHAEFAKISAEVNNPLQTITNYETFLNVNQELKYANSKPPGHLLLYMITQKISNLYSPKSQPMDKFNRLTTFSSYFFPFISYLVLIPLFYLSRHFLDRKQSYYVCILYIFIPSTALVTLHLDQVIYPLLFVTTLYLSLLSALKENKLLAIVTGLAVYISIFVSFSLLPLVLFAPIGIILFSVDWDKRSYDIKKIAVKLGWFMLGFLILFFLFKYALNYDMLLRYSNAIAFHQTWKTWDNSFDNILLFIGLNTIEFSCWVGITMVIFSFSNMGKSVMNLISGKTIQDDILPLLFLFLFILLGLFGKTKGEVNRLWIFIIPFICIFVVSEIEKRFKSRSSLVLKGLLVIQFIGIVIIKRYQDFW